MDFVSIILFLIMYYLRPQEWIGPLNSLRPVQLVMIFALAAMVMRNRGLQLRDFFQTPHDWAVYIFLGWVIFTSGDVHASWSEMSNRLVFYVVVLQALNTWERIERFIWWWVLLLFGVATLAVASEYGFDPTQAHDLTHGWAKDRLLLNMSIFNNPNALGHSVIILVPMVYFLCVWHRPIFTQEMGLLLWTVPGWCLYLTQSKGSYVSGAVTFAVSMIFGRPKVAQIAILVLFLLIGNTVIYSLPRMGTLQKGDIKTEGGIWGRVTAFRFGWRSMHSGTKGIGHLQWWERISRDTHWPIASHSSYVLVGAEEGRLGLYFYLFIFYCCYRTLITARCTTDREERVRRVLFTALLGFTVSSWMVDFAYRGVFFFQAAVIAAFHRLLIRNAKEAEAKAAPQKEPTQAVPVTIPPAPVAPVAYSRILRNWNRIGVLDIGLVYLMLYVWLRIWSYVVYKL